MKLPEKIIGRNRIRDGQIVVCWKKQDMSTDEIATKFKLSQRRIEQILRVNHAFIKIDKEWEKDKRIHWLKNQLSKKKDTTRDAMDIQDALRKEIEGDGEQSQRETKVIIIREGNGNTNSKRDVSGSVSVLRV